MKELSISRAVSLLLVALALALFGHYIYLSSVGISLSENLTWQAYLFNGLAATGILIFLMRLAQKNKSNLGFIFMAGSFLKFLVFFLLFFPEYKADGEMQTIEFSSFFIPYAICLSVKSFILIRMLNRAD